MNAKCGLGSFRNARRFSSHGMNLRKNLEIHPNPIVEVGSPVSRVEMNAKGAPLTPACPHRRLSTRFSRPRAVKMALTKPTQSYTVNLCPLLWDVKYRDFRCRSCHLPGEATMCSPVEFQSSTSRHWRSRSNDACLSGRQSPNSSSTWPPGIHEQQICLQVGPLIPQPEVRKPAEE